MIKLPEKRRRFAEEYVKLGNAYQAAINAGYADASAQTYGSRMLKDPMVQEYISQLEASLKANLSDRVASKEDILIFLTNTMNGIDTVETHDGQEIINPVPRRDRLRAAEMLGKFHDMFREEKDTALPTSITINISDGSD